MRTQILFKTQLVLIILLSFQFGIAQNIQVKSTPDEPGERKASSIVKLLGIPLNNVSVSVVYGTDSLEVKNAFILNKKNPSKYFETKASLKDLKNGTVEATVIFPHSGLEPKPREKIFAYGTKVYFSWARTHIPNGATEELTINSPVSSFVMPRPLTIAYMGDSYASGEGGKGDEPWENDACHRSNNSGGVLAIKKLIAERKDVAFDYVNTTCSGARVIDFFLVAQPVDPSKNATKQDKQLDIVKSWLSRKKYDGLDILLADGGGNDIGFGNLVGSGLLSFFRELRTDKALNQELNTALDNLPDVYESFMNFLNAEITPSKIVWMNYPNPLIGEGDRLCYQHPSACWGILENQIANEDWEFINNNIFKKLNDRVAEAATLHGWDLVDVSKKANGFGVCNCEGYFNTLGQSIMRQGDERGTFHPNVRGFKVIYKEAIYKKLDANVDAIFKDRKMLAIKKAKEAAKARIKLQNNKKKELTLINNQSNFSDKIKPLKKVSLE
ncbi:GDSL-type esterase/lipase family protein [Flavobacterium sp. NRK F7]|uniref:GDSL-type esterase/lipase family protein n=1 Tax=Flavobacterium sp. NRK F7 TaxID=2954930 RepID=UPI002090F565|nr:GDSL-type esterase/lipase family protein [Flavobacterium sp. NRK F7]MCO6163277.1 GDSL-type esterase/lipase family protein [Flavobacterium sp. NRK F7]